MFVKGQKVVVTESYQGLQKGSTGVVAGVSPNHVAIEVGNEVRNFRGHQCAGFVTSGRGWWMPASHIKVVFVSKLEERVLEYVKRTLDPHHELLL